MPKKTKVKVKAEKVAEVPISKADYYKKLMNEATDPLKVIEYRFWMETAQGKNPSVPSHMAK